MAVWGVPSHNATIQRRQSTIYGALSTGVIVEIGQAVETDTALAVTGGTTAPTVRPRVVVAGVASGTTRGVVRPPSLEFVFDSQAFSYGPASSSSVSIGIASETDTAFTHTAAKRKAVGLSAETDTAQALTRVKSRAIGISSETDSAFAVGKSKVKAIGLNTETDTALAATSRKTKAIGLVTETDTAQAHTSLRTRAVGQAQETDSAFATGKLKTLAVGQASETDTALAVTALKTKAVGQASETDTALPVAGGTTPTLINRYLHIADTAENVTAAVPAHSLAPPVARSQVFQALTSTLSQSIGQATETDTALPVTGGTTAPSVRPRVVVAGTGTDTIRGIAQRQPEMFGEPQVLSYAEEEAATEVAIGLATETDSSLAATSKKTKAVGITSETDTALSVTRKKTKAVGLASETDTSQPLTPKKIRMIGIAQETDTAFGMSVPEPFNTGLVSLAEIEEFISSSTQEESMQLATIEEVVSTSTQTEHVAVATIVASPVTATTVVSSPVNVSTQLDVVCMATITEVLTAGTPEDSPVTQASITT
jgi:hypothetical protein